jgi:DNA-binding SARP family transcriptional activator
MMEYSDVEENAAAAHNVWILSFDKEIREKVKAETGLMEALKKLKDSSDRMTSKAAKGALWTISEGYHNMEKSRSEERGKKPTRQRSNKYGRQNRQHKNKRDKQKDTNNEDGNRCKMEEETIIKVSNTSLFVQT